MKSKISEFFTALICAVILASIGVYAGTQLKGTTQTVVIVIDIIAAPITLYLLRKHFGRNK
ncbi:MAG: hypothetical protein ACYC0V_12575 [Armatimonadota bacterium]